MASKAKLPVLVSVPHGGVKIPYETKRFCRLKIKQILKDGDTWAGFLYDLEDCVLSYHCFPLARAVLDVNRAPSDRPPKNPDGVVKTYTNDFEPIWSKDSGLSNHQVEVLLNKYYYPYHQNLKISARNRHILLGLDCHTMLDRAPPITTGTRIEEKRPLVCLSNRGDQHGEEIDEPVTAPPGLLKTLAGLLEERIKNQVRDPAVPVVTLNNPFKGGYISKKHALEDGIPWIQVEINRSLYLFDPPQQHEPNRESMWQMIQIKNCLVECLEQLFAPGNL